MLSNIYLRKDGRYEARIALGKDNTGKRQYRSVYGRTAEETEQKLLAISTHEYSITKITVKEITLEYIAALRPQIKESTLANYRMKAEKHIIPAFGMEKCHDMTANMVAEFINHKIQQGLSARYVADIVVLLKGIFRYAARVHNIRYPLDGVKAPKCNKADVTVLSKSEQTRLIYIATNDNDLRSLGVITAMYTGMRIGELCALKWGDIDFDNGIIRVRRTLQRIQTADDSKKTKIVITKPKSASSVRDIPIPDCLMPLLAQRRRDNDMYVLSGIRKPVECRAMQYYFTQILKNANLPSVHFHSLRHAFATNCIALGFDIKTLSEILGHSRVEITLNRYVHSSLERKRAYIIFFRLSNFTRRSMTKSHTRKYKAYD